MHSESAVLPPPWIFSGSVRAGECPLLRVDDASHPPSDLNSLFLMIFQLSQSVSGCYICSDLWYLISCRLFPCEFSCCLLPFFLMSLLPNDKCSFCFLNTCFTAWLTQYLIYDITYFNDSLYWFCYLSDIWVIWVHGVFWFIVCLLLMVSFIFFVIFPCFLLAIYFLLSMALLGVCVSTCFMCPPSSCFLSVTVNNNQLELVPTVFRWLNFLAHQGKRQRDTNK